MEKWIDEIAAEITIDSLPESYQAVALIVGVEPALKLSEYLGGSTFYFPQIGGLMRAKRDEMIRREFNGCNYRELARKYGLTETWIRDIVQRKPSYEQTDMFKDAKPS